MNPLCTLSIFPFISFSKRNLLSSKIALFRELNEKSAYRICSFLLSQHSVTIDGDLEIQMFVLKSNEEGVGREYEGQFLFIYSTGRKEIHPTMQDFFSFHLERPGTKIGLMALEWNFDYVSHLRLFVPYTIRLRISFLSGTHLDDFLASLRGKKVQHLLAESVDQSWFYKLNSSNLLGVSIKKLTVCVSDHFFDASLLQLDIPLFIGQCGAKANEGGYKRFEKFTRGFLDKDREPGSHVSCYFPHGSMGAEELISCLTEDFGFEHGYVRHLECLWKPMANNKTAYFLVGFRSEVTKYDFLDPFYRVKLICLEEKPTQHRCLEMKVLHWISVFQLHMATTYIHQFWVFLCFYTKLKRATLLVDAMRSVEKFQLPILLFFLTFLCLPPFLLIFGITFSNFLLYFLIGSLFQYAVHYSLRFPEWAGCAHFTDFSTVLDPNHFPPVEPVIQDFPPYG